MRSWKVIVGLLGLWLVIMLYMSMTLMPGGDSSTRSEEHLKRALVELDKVKAQNRELQLLATELQDIREAGGTGNQDDTIKRLHHRLHNAMQEIKDLSKKSGESGKTVDAPSGQHEKTLRKVENTAVEFWYYIHSQLLSIKEIGGGTAAVVEKVTDVLQVSSQYQRTLHNDFVSLRNVDNMGQWREQESHNLGELIQKRLHYIQNPKDCSKAKKIVCNLHKGCGFGCQLHHVVYCLIVAYATKRTLVLESKGWRYAPEGWETVFQPLSNTCTNRAGESSRHWGPLDQIKNVQVIELPIVDSMHPRPDFMPLAIPEDLAPRLTRLHGDPPVWWIGQFVKYLMRPQKNLKEEIERTKQKLQFKNPIVGVHVRRTDKVGVEAAFHSIEEYMAYVDDYYDKLEARKPELLNVQRRVYLATDDPNLLKEAREKFKKYIFISDNDISKSAGLGSRYSDSSLRGIILDMHFLSLTDYLVCTFSSQVCRVAYELMQTIHGDASTYFKSLDDVYYFGGQNAHNMIALEHHKHQHPGEISMEVGDLLGIAGNHWNGYSKGINRRTSQNGLYPSYKVTNDITIVKMPLYPEVKPDS
ncbi:alpha-(1,6)-fucosyltransferase-like [Gigantopelta aegis]|uniref:alpha-(1,6)-fucosyltransferase-like n=1 Tax=Gigantopelta aegis TaxID=1735272 RepID=UPI001B887D77|nr:alpha-(1,6)-fucosyltransferase-like [Gigantopelta aegis]